MPSPLPNTTHAAPSLTEVFPVEILERVLLNLDASSIISCLEVSHLRYFALVQKLILML